MRYKRFGSNSLSTKSSLRSAKDKESTINDDQLRKLFKSLARITSGHDLSEVALDVVCVALGLNRDVVRQLSLRLIVRHVPPMLGLSKHDFGTKSNRETYTEQYMGWPLGDGSLSYELDLVGKGVVPHNNRIVGVWVPTSQDLNPHLLTESEPYTPSAEDDPLSKKNPSVLLFFSFFFSPSCTDSRG